MTLLQQPIIRPSLTVVAAWLLVAGWGAVAVAQDEGSGSTRWNQAYIAIGGGISRLSPDSDTNSIDVGEPLSGAVSLAIGYDFNRWLSAEIYGADLGSASIDFLGQDVGDVDYRVFGASVLGTFYRSGGFNRGREGLSFYGRMGIGAIDNDTELDFRRDHEVHVAFGAGAEYGFANGFAVRGELNSYDTDAQLLQVSLVKRFGGHSHQNNRARAITPVVPVAPLPVAPKVPEIKPEPPATLPKTYFGFDIDTLSADANSSINSIAHVLRDVDGLIVIEGHADSTGSEDYNQALSIRRANAVRDALVGRGINADRLVVRGLGEGQPAATNSTSEGRALNRRVEVTLRAQ